MHKKDITLSILGSCIVMGYMYSIDIPQALEVPLRQQPLNLSTKDFNLIYIFTFAPIVVLDIFIGILIDRYSIIISLIILHSSSILSQTICGIMLQYRPYSYLEVVYGMRSILGISGEALFTAQALIICRYGKNNYEIVMGVCLSLPFIFGSISSLISTEMYDLTQNISIPLYFGSFFCFLALITTIILIKNFIIGNQKEFNSNQISQKQDNKSNLCKSLLNFHELKSLNGKFWILIFAIFCSEASLGPFYDNLNDLMVKRFCMSYVNAGRIILIPFFLMGIFSFLLGKLLHQYPFYRRIIYFYSSLLYFFSLVGLFLIPNSLQTSAIQWIMILIFLIVLGFNYSVYYSTITAGLSYVVDASVIGTAWGICGSTIALAQCIVPLANIYILNLTDDLPTSYQNLSLFGAVMSFFPILISAYIQSDKFQVLDELYQEQLISAENQSSLLE